MTELTNERERAAFEAWHRSKFATRHSTGQPTRDMHNGIYAENYGPANQQQMWEAWQAACKSTAEQVEQIRREAVEADRRARGEDDGVDESVVYLATARNGETCYFGRHSFAKEWAGASGSVQEVKLPCRDLKVVEQPASAAQGEIVSEIRAALASGTMTHGRLILLLARAADQLARMTALADANHQAAEAAQRRADRVTELARQSQEPQAERDGWKLVPVKLTDDMAVAFAEAWYSEKRCYDDPQMDDCYAAMLAAAPAHPVAQPAPVRQVADTMDHAQLAALGEQQKGGSA